MHYCTEIKPEETLDFTEFQTIMVATSFHLVPFIQEAGKANYSW